LEFAFWNTLHDGGIDAIRGSVPGDLTLTVGIEYLCDLLPTPEASIQVDLLGCTTLAFTPYDERPIVDPQAIAALELEILSAGPGDGTIEVCCVSGTLTAVYRAVEMRTAEGNPITQSELEAVAHRYWSEWKARNRRS
jgi:hypothetical protein